MVLLTALTALASAAGPLQASSEDDDQRENFEADLFLGSAIDSFAAGELNLYLNPDASGKTDLFERLVGGIEFGYRLFGDPKATEKKRNQIWVIGRTVHGVRSTDVNCMENGELSVCRDSLAASQNPTEEFLYILRNASSLEAALGFRWEFLQLNPGRQHSARVYVGGEYGFITVTGDDDDVIDLTKLGIGVIATTGRFQGSFLQAGYGNSDLFERNRSGRLKVDAMLRYPFQEDGAVSMIARIHGDVDGGDGADSIQSYFGLSYRFGNSFFSKKDEETPDDSSLNSDTSP